MGFAEAVAGTDAPPEILASLTLLSIRHLGFDGRWHRGQLVVRRELAEELATLFEHMASLRFPLKRVIPIARYGWSDEASMAADNSSAFNYRLVAGTDRLSLHAEGRAVDINPRENPVVYADGRVLPAGSCWQPESAGTLSENHPVVQAFLARGWRWGGHFSALRDYHHFEK